METTSTPPRRALAATAVGAITLASALAFAAPGQAATTGSFSGCKTTVANPEYRETSSVGDDRYTYRFYVECSGNRTVTYQHEAYQDRPILGMFEDYKLRGMRTGKLNFSQDANVQSQKSKSYWYTLRDFNTLGREKIFHRVRIKVTSNGVESKWSSWYSTKPISVKG